MLRLRVRVIYVVAAVVAVCVYGDTLLVILPLDLS